jgi:hypothetical protein
MLDTDVGARITPHGPVGGGTGDFVLGLRSGDLGKPTMLAARSMRSLAKPVLARARASISFTTFGYHAISGFRAG